MNRRKLILLGAFSFLAGLILLSPAATLNGWFMPKQQPAPFAMLGLQGTLTQGIVSSVQLNGRPALSDIRWSLRPLSMLLLRAGFHLEGGGEQTLINGKVSVSPLGTLRLGDFIATGSIKPLLAAAGQAFLPVDGQVRLNLQHLKLRKGLPQSVEGEIQIQNLAWTLAREPLILGDYRAELTTESGNQLVKINSVSGPLELSGEGKFMQDLKYEIELKLKPKADASPMLRNLVGGAGAPDPQGYYRIRQQGSLAPK